MANNVMVFDPSQPPAHVKKAQEAGTSNIVTRSQINTLTFPGKVWTINVNGDKRPVTRTTPDGEEELVQVFDVIIIAYNENRGRSYYGGRTYDPGQESAPVCWSNDGVTSDPNSTERQSEKCNVCPQAIKGSRQTDQGKAAAACGVHRNLAVIPKSRDLSTAPLLRLKIPQTSDFDGLNKEAQAKQMFAFTNYLTFLKSKQVPFTYSLTTKIRFDNTKTYPKLWFSPGRWLTEEETQTCAEIAASGNLDDLLKTDFTGFGNVSARPPGITEEDEVEMDEGEGEDEVIISQPAAKPTAKPAAPAPAPARVIPATFTDPPKARTMTQKKVEAATAAAAARKAAVLEDDDDVEPAVAIAAGRAPAATATPALDNILKDWDDE